jgi:hypothetical protein
VQAYFNDFVTIAFVEIDVSECPHVLDDFSEKTLPAYGMMSDHSILGLCNAPDTFEKMKNFFFDYAYKSYKKLKGFKMYSSDFCNITYPEIKGEMVFDVDHDKKVAKGHSFVV